ncbi:MAG: SDR family oxidoreductase [Candidatus Binatia bacterium]|nr:SDR family oxidoreductase [Candidatus Binatia bacterium]MDG1958436.1 SDR family oxidoreductase [Candidatus Binatia bacterium]MDG2011319.1 SDR family oxidoreductase [Candidatus Binatia bacterium]
MAETRRDIALITGASEGIGRELARAFSDAGFHVAVVARSRDRLESLADELRSAGGPRVHALPHDLLDPHAPVAIAAQLEEMSFDVDVLVNNAGVMEVGRFHEQDDSSVLGQVNLNAVAPTALCRQFIPGMVARGRGRVLNIASTAGFQAMPGMSTYAASKAYLLALGEGLAEELIDTGVTVTTLAPGPVQTQLWRGAQQNSPRAGRMIPDAILGDAAAIAQEGFAACMAGEVVRVPGLGNRLTASISDVIPRSIVRRLAGVVGRRIV